MDWKECWEELRTPWKHEQGDIDLSNFLRSHSGSGKKALVPLCGDSVATRLLAESGFFVTGVELVEKAIEVAIKTHFPEEKFTKYESERVKFIAGDILEVTLPENHFDLVYDRAAFVALHPENRKEYAEVMTSALAPGGKLIIVGYDYIQPGEPSPPHPVTKEEVLEIFGSLNLEKTSRETTSEPPSKYADEVQEMKVFCLHLTK